MSNKHGSQFAEQGYYISSATPTDGDAVLGQFWIDPDDGKLYRVTSLGPIVFTEVSQYTDALAIAAVEGEATLDLSGDLSVAAGKTLSVDTIIEKTCNDLRIPLTRFRQSYMVAIGLLFYS